MAKQRLGQSGPYMVCRECNSPLNLFSLVDEENEWDEEKIVYVHPLERITADGTVEPLNPDAPYDHEAVPVEGSPIDADAPCDFCHRPGPKWVFVPRRPIRMPDPEVPNMEHDYSSPWACCDGCLQAVQKKKLSKMLNRAMQSPYGMAHNFPPDMRPIIRQQLWQIYVKYIDSNPAGPYEVRIPGKAKPIKKPRKGM